MTWRIKLLAPVVLILGLAGCGTTINPGYVGIKVNSWGSQRGVSDYPISTGRVAYNPWTTTVVEYPTFVQTTSWTRNPNEGHPSNEEISFSSKEGTAFTADISISYNLDAEKVPNFYVKFRADNIDTWTHGYLRNLARNTFDSVAGEFTVEQVMGDNGPLVKAVKDQMQGQLSEFGVHIDQIGFIGRPRPPEAVDEMLSAKVKAQQIALQKQAEVVQAEQDAKSTIARAQGDAEANRIRSASITDNIIKMKSLENQNAAISKWDGQMPYMLTSDGSKMLFNIPTTQGESKPIK